MLIPKKWCQAEAETKLGKKVRKVRRWGWGATTEEAGLKAAQRCREAISKIEAGEKGVNPVEGGGPYPASMELPIREEIVKEGDGWAVTRNSYGALCMNTERLAFLDVDISKQPSGKRFLTTGTAVLGFIAWMSVGGFKGFALGCATWGLSWMIAKLERRMAENKEAVRSEAERKRFLSRLPEICDKNGWAVRLYETPMGFRMMGVHGTEDPKGERLKEMARDVGADGLFVMLCERQGCFRARVSPKPWRVGMARLSRDLVWTGTDSDVERKDRRAEWVKEYERKTVGVSSCRFVGEFGKASRDESLKELVEIHDKMSEALEKERKLG